MNRKISTPPMKVKAMMPLLVRIVDAMPSVSWYSARLPKTWFIRIQIVLMSAELESDISSDDPK